MVITDRNLSVGTKLYARYKGQTYTCQVVLDPSTNASRPIAYRVDGQEKLFKSPSTAGAAVMGEGRTCNGWVFWTVGEPDAAKAPARRTARTRAVSAVPKPQRERRGGRAKSAAPAKDANGDALPIIERLDEQFECGECGQVFATTEDASEHFNETHGVVELAS